ncbi:MAG: hypothetical protein ACREV5_18150 [Steroidobacter sp.]
MRTHDGTVPLWPSVVLLSSGAQNPQRHRGKPPSGAGRTLRIRRRSRRRVHGSSDGKLNVSRQNAALCAQLSDDVIAEQAELQREADTIDYWPVFSLGVSYRF